MTSLNTPVQIKTIIEIEIDTLSACKTIQDLHGMCMYVLGMINIASYTLHQDDITKLYELYYAVSHELYMLLGFPNEQPYQLQKHDF